MIIITVPTAPRPSKAQPNAAPSWQRFGEASRDSSRVSFED